MTFNQLCTAVGALCLALCLILVLLPDIIYWLFRLDGNLVGDVLAKRSGLLLMGISVLCIAARHSRSAEVQRLVALSVGTSMGALAILGLFELAQGNVGAGILLAVVTELAIAGLFGRIWFGARAAD